MDKLLKTSLILFSLAFSFMQANSQQLPLYSQYMMNKFLLNPALAGGEGYTTVNLTAREQWLGLKDAPSTHALSVQTRLLNNNFILRRPSVRRRHYRSSRGGNVGLGAYLYNDRNGIFDRTGIQLTYAYHIPMDESQLSFGVSATAFQFTLNDQLLKLYQQQDQLVNGSDKTLYVPDANFGVYFGTPTYYVGLSAAQLLQSSLKFGSEGGSDFKMLRTYFLTGGYKWDLRNDYEIEPSLLMKTTENFKPQLDINTKVYYQDKYWGGLSYRTGNGGGALIFMAGLKVNKFYFGYAFDYTLSNIGRYTYGSHEVMIAAKFGSTPRRYKWLNNY